MRTFVAGSLFSVEGSVKRPLSPRRASPRGFCLSSCSFRSLASASAVCSCSHDLASVTSSGTPPGAPHCRAHPHPGAVRCHLSRHVLLAGPWKSQADLGTVLLQVPLLHSLVTLPQAQAQFRCSHGCGPSRTASVTSQCPLSCSDSLGKGLPGPWAFEAAVTP